MTITVYKKLTIIFSSFSVSTMFVSFGIVVVFADGIVKVLGIGVLIRILVVVIGKPNLKADIN